ncbi:Copper chaperone domain-containing protein [Dioscorea alata]|uniref:Copper chaperone domain-containing protein n=1 Tax=Dioscorea alata TaxID=55571 RepID=A0ACB7TXD5_DIOAL|nr:Copper chaperone domain-containing protein [Dioscorea alata]
MKGKMGKGMLCRSESATAVCISGDRSVVVPRKPDHRALINDHSKLSDMKYSRLVTDSQSFNSPSCQNNGVLTLPVHSKKNKHLPLNPNPNNITTFQVVVMRVSLHCQGCAGKVKKHISKMEGVTSFSIDLEAKRVTVMGHVSPDCVLESISKVKKAEFWSC